MMRRIIRIVLSPRDEWSRIAGESGHGALLYAFLLSMIPAAASFVMARNSDVKVPESAVLATYLASLLTILAVAAAFWMLVRLNSGDESLRRCIQVSAYGATPLLLAGAFLVTPVLVIVCLLALPHVLYLYYLGVQRLLRVPGEEAAQFVGLAVVAAFVASTLGGGALGALGLL
jgi:hypothetical protein